MAEHRYVSVSLPEAEYLAGLYGISMDLRACLSGCEKYLELYSDALAGSAPWDLEPWAIYALVKYGRCFKSGVRKEASQRMRKAILEVDEGFHCLVVQIRDKHISHSLNDMESHILSVWLNPEERGRRVNGVNMQSQFVTGFGRDFFETLSSLVRWLLEWVEDQKRSEGDRLKFLVEKRYSLSELYSRGPLEPGYFGMENASVSRKRID